MSLKNDRFRGGFTVTEIIVVLVIIVMILGLGIGGWRAMIGASSVEAAQNRMGATLGRVREEALTTRTPRGLLLFNKDETVLMATVYHDDPNGRPGQLEIVPESEISELQSGIGALFINNGVPRYSTPGVLLFDGYGQVFMRDFSVRKDGKLGKLIGLTDADLPKPSDPPIFTHLGVTLFESGKYERVATPERDKWLDHKGRSLFVNRYSGTLVEGRAQ